MRTILQKDLNAVMGAARDWCKQHDLRVCVFPWNESYETSGLTKDAIYLLRPDTYVALAAQQQDPELLGSYFADRNLSPGSATH